MVAHVRACGRAGDAHRRSDEESALLVGVVLSHAVCVFGNVLDLFLALVVCLKVCLLDPGIEAATKRGHGKGFRLALLPREFSGIDQVQRAIEDGQRAGIEFFAAEAGEK